VVDVLGYTWGTTTMYMSNQYGKPAPRQPSGASFDRIIIADCLWMPSQHVNLVKTVLHYLDSDSDSSAPDACACALVIAGFHTGRGIVRHFFDVATGDYPDEEEREAQKDDPDPELEAVRGQLKAVSIFEIDVGGTLRPWQLVRPGEDRHQAKRWSVCAVLVKR